MSISFSPDCDLSQITINGKKASEIQDINNFINTRPAQTEDYSDCEVSGSAQVYSDYKTSEESQTLQPNEILEALSGLQDSQSLQTQKSRINTDVDVEHLKTLNKLLYQMTKQDHNFVHLGSDGIRESLDDILTYKNAPARVFRMPWLTQEYVNYLNARLKTLDFTPTDPDNYYTKTPQLRLSEVAPGFFLEIYYKFFNEIAMIPQMLCGVGVSDISEIMFIRRDANLDEIAKFHRDNPAIITLTIELGDDYESDNFQISSGGVFGEVIELPRANIGEATVFLGKSNFHKSPNITKGTRDLLVIWLSDDTHSLKLDDNFNKCKVNLHRAILGDVL